MNIFGMNRRNTTEWTTKAAGDAGRCLARVNNHSEKRVHYFQALITINL